MAQCTGVVRLVCESIFHEYVRVLTCVVFVFTGVIPVAHWFHVAKGKGQRWQPDTGSICGSLFTSLRADIICYNPSATSPPVTWHIIVSANTSFIVFGLRRGMDFVNLISIFIQSPYSGVSSDIWAVSRWRIGWTSHRNYNETWKVGKEEF